VEHGKTGFLVGGVEELARALRGASTIRPEDCRRAAEARFDLRRAMGEYLALYERLVATARDRPTPRRRVAVARRPAAG
jgi:hypothetical protein